MLPPQFSGQLPDGNPTPIWQEINLGKFYDDGALPDELRRDFDVYDRISTLGVDLGTFEDSVVSLAGANIPGVIFHESGLVYLSGMVAGTQPMNDGGSRVKHGQDAGTEIADGHLKRLHWALSCGGEGGDLNDVLYIVKALGMVVSTDVEFGSGPAVVNGFSGRWQSVYGGALSEFAVDGEDPGGYSGVHARTAIGGFTGRFSLEAEIIVAIAPELAKSIIRNRGWLFPLPPVMYDKVRAAHG
jgi:hypothetical protein